MIEQKKTEQKILNTTALLFSSKKEVRELKDLRIIFMGTPDFAVASLKKLVEYGCNIVSVITAPDKPGGRGMELQQSAVKKYAVEQSLNILQPEKLKNPEFIKTLQELNADVQIVVAFRMLPEVVWDMPPMGTINVHGSLLPQYRGAAPINWAVINGENETGVTTFKLQHAIDTGDILLQESFPINENDTAGDVHDKMMEVGASLLLKTLLQLAGGTLVEQPQAASDSLHQTQPAGENVLKSAHGERQMSLKHAPKIFTETCIIDFTKTVDEVYNLVRGLSPFPTAFTQLDGKKLKIFSCEKINEKPAVEIGAYRTDSKTYLQFACANGYIAVKELQLEGKKKMLVEDFLRGYRFG